MLVSVAVPPGAMYRPPPALPLTVQLVSTRPPLKLRQAAAGRGVVARLDRAVGQRGRTVIQVGQAAAGQAGRIATDRAVGNAVVPSNCVSIPPPWSRAVSPLSVSPVRAGAARPDSARRRRDRPGPR